MNNSASFGVFYSFLHSLPTLSLAFDLLALVLAYHFKNTKIFYIIIAILVLKISHLVESIYQAHLIISLIFPFVYCVVLLADNSPKLELRTGIVWAGFFSLIALFVVIMSSVTTFSSDISSVIFKSDFVYKLSSPITQLSFVMFCFFCVIVLVYTMLAQLGMVYFIAYVLGFMQFLFYKDSAAVSYYEFSGFCFVIYFMIVSYRLMFYDQLTRLLNRRAYDRFDSKDYYLAIADIDHFKSFNDNFGHDVGDMVLKITAKIMKKTCKKAKSYRLGGEEFVIIFDNNSQEYVEKTLENFRQTLANHKIKLKNQQTNITISIGVSKNQENKEKTLKSADQNLYKAKQNGRNQIVW